MAVWRPASLYYRRYVVRPAENPNRRITLTGLADQAEYVLRDLTGKPFGTPPVTAFVAAICSCGHAGLCAQGDRLGLHEMD